MYCLKSIAEKLGIPFITYSFCIDSATKFVKISLINRMLRALYLLRRFFLRLLLLIFIKLYKTKYYFLPSGSFERGLIHV